jgi:hypothetical protein
MPGRGPSWAALPPRSGGNQGLGWTRLLLPLAGPRGMLMHMPKPLVKLVCLLAPKRAWFQIRLRTLFVLVAVCALPCGSMAWKMDRKRRERGAVIEVQRRGGMVVYDWYNPHSIGTGPKARHFATFTAFALNRVVRPFTAKWHQLHVEGALANEVTRREFRGDLIALLHDLRRFATLLGALAEGDAFGLGPESWAPT